MKTILLAVFTLILLADSAHAWIGATPTQCTGVYGTAVLVDKESMTMEFRKDDFIYKCSFAGGVCVKIEIQHPQPLSSLADKGTKNGKPISAPKAPPLTESEVTRFLVENGNGSKWISGKHSTNQTEDGLRTSTREGAALVITVSMPKVAAGTERIIGRIVQVVPEGLLVAKSADQSVLVTGIKETFVDGDRIDVTAQEAGVWQYSDTLGATRTVRKYQVK